MAAIADTMVTISRVIPALLRKLFPKNKTKTNVNIVETNTLLSRVTAGAPLAARFPA